MVFEAEKVEELIIDTIQNIQERKKRAKSITVCKSVEDS